jgi:hypothetical protein
LLSILLIIICIFVPLQPVHAAVMFLVIGSAYPIPNTQTPMPTSRIPSQT